MSNSICLIGSGGHSRSVIALLKDNGYTINSIFDDSWKINCDEKIMNIPIAGNIDAVSKNTLLCIAVGDNQKREVLFNKFETSVLIKNVAHSTAYIDKSAQLKNANLIFGKAFINAMCIIGSNNIINTSSVIEHETVIGNHNHISVAAVLCGRVKIGNNCFIGAGTVIKDSISICDNVVIGAGAVVVKNITEPGIYVGNPSKKIK